MDAFFYEHRDETLYIGEMTHYPFPVHVHDVVEVVCVTAGTIRLSINGISYNLCPGDVAVVFPLTPHGYEQIGEGALGFDLEGFGARAAYTVDGEDPAVVDVANFNAALATFDVRGLSVHPGSA